MDQKFEGGRLILRRTEAERAPMLNRLRRIEGQVRGLQQMIEQDRYCGDELQQVSAMIAALREVSLLLTAQHVGAGVERMVAGEDQAAGMEDVIAVMRAALRHQ